MKLEFSAELSKQVLAALSVMSPAAISRVLDQVEREAMAGGGVLEKHWIEGQGEWPDNAPAWLQRKRSGQIMRDSGELLAAAKTIGHPARKTRKTLKKGRLSVWLQKMEDGKNVYDIAQNGTLGGLSIMNAAGGVLRKIGAAAVVAAAIAEADKYRSWALQNGATLQRDRSNRHGSRIRWNKGMAGVRQQYKSSDGGMLKLGKGESAARNTRRLPTRRMMDARAEDSAQLAAAVERAVSAQIQEGLR